MIWVTCGRGRYTLAYGNKYYSVARWAFGAKWCVYDLCGRHVATHLTIEGAQARAEELLALYMLVDE